jgi:hypothetical protein
MKHVAAIDEAAFIDVVPGEVFIDGRVDSNKPANTYRITSVSSNFTGFYGSTKGTTRRVKFAVAGLVVVHNATTFILPTGANITTQNGDWAEFIRIGTEGFENYWECTNYHRKDGSPLVSAPDNTKLPLAGGTMTGAINEAPIARVNLTASTIGAASAGANTIQVDPGGGTSITSFGPAPDSGVERWVILGADGITLVNSSNLIIPGGADIIGKTRDRIKIVSISATAWLVLDYVKADGTPVITPSDSSKVSTSAIGAANGVAPLGADSKIPAAYLPAGNVFRIENIAATSAGQTSFAIPNGYTAGAIIPFFKGPVLAPADYTATDGANVVLAVGADAIGDVLTVVVLGALRAQDDALLQYTVAGLPAASANLAKQRWCTNMAGGAGVVVSNGTNWVRVADNTIVTV